MTEHMHDCHVLLRQLSDYISGEAAESLCAEIEAHLADCEDCRIMVDTLRKTILLYRSGRSDELPSDVRRRLHRRLALSEFLIE